MASGVGTDAAPVVPWSLTLDCADPARAASFWAQALGYVPAPPPEGWATWEAWCDDMGVPEDERDDGAALVDPSGRRPALTLLRVPEPKERKNRLHLDLHVSGGRHLAPDVRGPRLEAAVERLVAAGGTVLQRHERDGHLDHVVLGDPEGHELCVV
ncbi:VOC family protein [Pseudokineococcus basanitobsidens]|uniref:VOC family protein n=1 Tax=Pseudokineococcus basanitobsidens TaxID=1926649 RepID=A0ABU8RL69_9ACTN